MESVGYGPDTRVQAHLDAEFMSLSILEGNQTFDVNNDKFRPGVSVSNSEVGLASLSIAAFILRLVCTNGMISTSAVSASYRHVSRKILDEFNAVMSRVGNELGMQKDRLQFSFESRVDSPSVTFESFNRQFGINKQEKEAVEWGYMIEGQGDTMFDIIQAYTRAAQFQGLPAESSFKLQKTGGNILAMLN